MRRFDGKWAAQTTSAGIHREAESHDIHFDILRDSGGTHSLIMFYDKSRLMFYPERVLPICWPHKKWPA